MISNNNTEDAKCEAGLIIFASGDIANAGSPSLPPFFTRLYNEETKL
jgi:hypothetical protein